MTRPDLERFVAAQQGVYDDVLAELKTGRKRSHWMWFVFPQVRGLGSSPTSMRYAIEDLDEARAYLAHPILGERLRACCELVLAADEGLSAEDVFGEIDALKLRSSATLFDLVEPNGPYARVLERFFSGERDARTLALLGVS
jgi:uncharacterized protein (DUF1810 family)